MPEVQYERTVATPGTAVISATSAVAAFVVAALLTPPLPVAPITATGWRVSKSRSSRCATSADWLEGASKPSAFSSGSTWMPTAATIATTAT